MIGVIERIKNSVLLKCSTLNDTVISDSLQKIIDTEIYYFAENIISLLAGINTSLTEEAIREGSKLAIEEPLIKKIKRKLFIDSLALQITNDSFIEEYVNGSITMDELKHNYISELNKNENSNQLNMTEDLNLTEIFENMHIYVNRNIIKIVSESSTLSENIYRLVNEMKEDLERGLTAMIKNTDEKYLEILTEELLKETKIEEKVIEKVEEEKRDVGMLQEFENFEIPAIEESPAISSNKFEKYDDMTLFNKMLLSLNTKAEKMLRKEKQLNARKEEIDKLLSATNDNIESNIQRENELSQKKVELSSREVELNSKLSEAEVIFLNMKPLIKGLNNISASDKGGNANE